MGEVSYKWSIVILVNDLSLFQSSVFDFLHLVSPVLNLRRYLWPSAVWHSPPGPLPGSLATGNLLRVVGSCISMVGPLAIRNERNAEV